MSKIVKTDNEKSKWISYLMIVIQQDKLTNCQH